MAFSKTTINRIIFLFLIALIAGAGVYFLRMNETMQAVERKLKHSEQERRRLQTTLVQSRAVIRGQKEQFGVVTQEKDELTAQREALQKEIDDLNIRVLQLQELLNKEKQANEALQSDREKLRQRIATLQDEIRLWEGNITSLEEADTVVEKRRTSAGLLQAKVRALRAKVQSEKKRVQREIDRIRLELGNRGYMVRNGETTYVAESAVDLERIIIRSTGGR